MRFDWYQATIPESPQNLIGKLTEQLSVVEVIPGKGKYNYHQSAALIDKDGDKVAMMFFGGPNGHPNVGTSGDKAPKFAEVVRELWPEHFVTRFDVAEDFGGGDVYDSLYNLCRQVAAEHKIKGESIIPDDPMDGRTYYMGAPSSDVRARLYDKAAEMRKRSSPADLAEVPDYLTRLEIQGRPRQTWRFFAAKMEPEHVWGMSAWSHHLGEAAFGMALQRIHMRARKETTHERSYRFLLTQYRAVLERQFRDLGSWSAVGLQMGDDLKKLLDGDL